MNARKQAASGSGIGVDAWLVSGPGIGVDAHLVSGLGLGVDAHPAFSHGSATVTRFQ